MEIKKLTFLLTTITITLLQICGPGKAIITEKLEVKKPQSSTTTEQIVYKKVPTKWVKITKKSN